MMDIFFNLSPIIQTLIASLFALSLTTLGSSFVFILKNTNKDIMDYLLSLSAGIMLSASIFSLLIPALDSANVLVVSLGIIGGTLFLIFASKFSDKYLLNKKTNNIFLLVISIILHNIPEGIAIGVAFGSSSYSMAAINLTIGIGLQNIPEGSAISIPLKRMGYSSIKSFLIGFLSGVVEPLSAILGVILVMKINYILPLLLSIASGAMILVVILELIPESQTNEHKNLISFLTIIGFIFMMILETI